MAAKRSNEYFAKKYFTLLQLFVFSPFNKLTERNPKAWAYYRVVKRSEKKMTNNERWKICISHEKLDQP